MPSLYQVVLDVRTFFTTTDELLIQCDTDNAVSENIEMNSVSCKKTKEVHGTQNAC